MDLDVDQKYVGPLSVTALNTIIEQIFDKMTSSSREKVKKDLVILTE